MNWLKVLKWPSVHLLVSLLALILLHPFAEQLPQPWPTRLTSLLTTAVLLAAVWWTSEARRHRVAAVVLVSVPIAALWFRQSLGPPATMIWVLFCIYVAGRLFAAVLGRRINVVDRVLAATSLYLLVAITFSFLHLMVYGMDPEAYSFPVPPTGEGAGDMLYFSMVTILTLGYGDIVPVAPFARMLTVTEAFIGAFFIAILIAGLVSQGKGPPRPQGGSDGGGSGEP